MIRLLALALVLIAGIILAVVLREERLINQGRIPMGRFRRFWGRDDRRLYPRFRVDWPVKYHRAKRNGPGNITAKDVSLGGAQLVVEEKLEVGVRLDLEFTLPGSSTPFFTQTQVMWVRPIPHAGPESREPRFFMIGIQFLEIPPALEKDLSARSLKTN